MTTAPSAQACIVFAHANGFPARTYRVLLDAWHAAGFQVLARVHLIGHSLGGYVSLVVASHGPAAAPPPAALPRHPEATAAAVLAALRA